MTSSPADPSRTEFRIFLQTELWDERHHMPLSLLSALARLDVDPWEQAAVLARLPSDEATRTLRGMLARLPGSATCAEFEALCDRAVALLPRDRTASQPAATGDQGVATPRAHRLDIKVVLLTLGMMLVSVVASELLARPGGPKTASGAQAGSTSAPGVSAPAPSAQTPAD